MKTPQKSNIPFEDQFNADLKKNWVPQNHSFENNLAQFSAKQISLKDGFLLLKLSEKRNGIKKYSGAELRSKQSFLYGKFEVRMKAAAAEGLVTAFFLYLPNSLNNTEIDVEISGKYPNRVTLNHWVNATSHDVDINLPFDTTADFHDYVIIWEPNKLSWQVDGKLIYSTNTAIPNQAMPIIFNLWASKSVSWVGHVNPAQLPATAMIDFVRYYPYTNTL